MSRIFLRAALFLPVFFAVGFFTASVHGVLAGEADIHSGLVGYWNFDEDDRRSIVLDRSGNGNDGTLVNGPTRENGKFGRALHLDGMSGYVTKTSPTNLPVGRSARTISAWVKPESLAPGGVLVHFGDNAGGGQEFIFDLAVSGGQTYLFTDSINGPNNITVTGSQIPTIGQWNHMVFVFDGDIGWTYYLNGSVAKSGIFPIAINTAEATVLNVGKRSDHTTLGIPYIFPGLIDEIYIYNRALSKEEVAMLSSFTSLTALSLEIPKKSASVLSTTLPIAFTYKTTLPKSPKEQHSRIECAFA